MRVKDVIQEGTRFGRIVVIGPPQRIYCGGRPKAGYACKCDCGKTILAEHNHVRNGDYMSCGCSIFKDGVWRSSYHGKTHSKEYQCWASMLERCRPVTGHPRYLAKGITVCDRWSKDFGFERFLEDMGNAPSSEHSIDRIDNSKGYYKENCRWADRKTQQRNRDCNRFITINGVNACLADHAERFGISFGVLFQRLKNGWPEHRLSEPLHYKNARMKKAGEEAVHSSSP